MAVIVIIAVIVIALLVLNVIIATKNNKDNTDNPSPIIVLLSLLFPIVGGIIYIANASTRRKYANICGVAGLLGLIISFVLWLALSQM